MKEFLKFIGIDLDTLSLIFWLIYQKPMAHFWLFIDCLRFPMFIWTCYFLYYFIGVAIKKWRYRFVFYAVPKRAWLVYMTTDSIEIEKRILIGDLIYDWKTYPISTNDMIRIMGVIEKENKIDKSIMNNIYLVPTLFKYEKKYFNSETDARKYVEAFKRTKEEEEKRMEETASNETSNEEYDE